MELFCHRVFSSHVPLILQSHSSLHFLLRITSNNSHVFLLAVEYQVERWKKIVKAADSGCYPNVMIVDGKLVTTPKADGPAKIQSFLADVFKDGDNEWINTEFDTLEANKGEIANEGQPGSSKEKKTSLTEQHTLARQEKIDIELGTARVTFPKGIYTPAEWKAITKVAKDLDGSTAVAKALDSGGVNLEGGALVATGHSVGEAHCKLSRLVSFAVERDSYGGP